MSKKRGRIEIIYDILTVIREKGGRIKPTHILYKSNLSHQMYSEYINELLSKKFVEEKKDKKNNKTYSLTNKGFNYLSDYNVIKSFIDSYGLD